MLQELLITYGLIPFWLCAGVTLLCLAAAWFRKSRRAAISGLAIVWAAGLFYVPYFFYHYVGHAKAVEASGVGVVLDPEDREFYEATFQAAVVYLALMGTTAATFTVLTWHRPRPPRKQNLELELHKALRARHEKAASKRSEETRENGGKAGGPSGE
jgi:glucan phosphoethanolaminetransferase (alkaline phosphatase superfamily)